MDIFGIIHVGEIIVSQYGAKKHGNQRLKIIFYFYQIICFLSWICEKLRISLGIEKQVGIFNRLGA